MASLRRYGDLPRRIRCPSDSIETTELKGPTVFFGVGFTCLRCGKCCEETEMTLLEEDMKRIEALGFQREEFAWFDGNFWRLRNINGHCVFLDPKTRLCKIYPYRPIGCRLYPLIYVEGEGPRVDVLCPNHHTYTEEEVRRNAPLLLRAVKQLFREAGRQLSS